MMTEYDEYFKSHLGYTNFPEALKTYQDWLHSQWTFVEKKLGTRISGNLLEIGSGIGGFYSILKETGCNLEHYTGLELDAKAVAFSNKYFQVESFKKNTLEEFTSVEKYNYIFAFEVLEHLANPLVSIKKITGLLEQGGVFIATTPYPFRKNIMADKSHLYVLHPENWKRLLYIAGFSEVALYPMSFIPFLWRLNKNLNPIIPVYLPFPQWISTCLVIAKK